MKKRILFSLLVFTLLFTLTGCFSKKALTAEEFKAKMSEKEFAVDEKNEGISDSILKKEYKAEEKNGKYEIDFYEFIDEKEAKGFYNLIKATLELQFKSGVVKTETEATNNQKYTVKSSDGYYVVIRVDNTVINVETSKTYKDAVDEIIDYLGY